MQKYPLTWPENQTRTPRLERKENFAWKKGTDFYRRHLWEQLRMLGVGEVLISTNKPLRIDGEFRADSAAPMDPGVAIYFEYRGTTMCFACDQYTRIEWNLHAIGMTVEAIRTIERCGASNMIERAFRGFTAIPAKAGEHWREYFEFPPDAVVTVEHVDKAYRAMAHIYHPDKGGTIEEWEQLKLARANALDDLKRANGNGLPERM